MANLTATRTLEYLLRHRHASRVEISRRLNLSRAALTAVVNNLFAEKLVKESGTGDSTGGKPPVMLEINGKAFTVAAIDIGSSRLLRGMLCDAAGNCIKTAEMPYSQENLLNDVCTFAGELINTHNISALAVALSGIVNYEQNTVVESANFPLAKSGIATILGDLLKTPVILGNRSRLAAEYESIYGAACGVDNFLYVSLGKSIGSAVCINGSVLNGANGAAGELRDFPCFINGEKLSLETLLSEKYLLDKNNASTFEELLSKWESKEKNAVKNLEQLIGATAEIFAFLCDFTDSPLLVPGGRFRHFGNQFQTLFKERFDTLANKAGRKREVVFSDAGEDAPLYGAAISAIRHTFNNLKTNRKGL